ncbi:MAG: polysaccharide biosynthesis/export family protein [Holophaga sp.]
MPSLPSPASRLFKPAAVSAARARGIAAGLALTLALACSSPGMKLDVRPSSHPTSTEMEGMRITLRKLDPQALQAQAAAAASSRPALAELLAEGPQPYRIGPQDVLLVTVWDHPEITLALGQYRTDAGSGLVVDEQGYLFFPYVGRFRVQGLTATEARARLTEELTRVLQKPQVDLKVLAYRSQKVFVGGEVKAPGIYNITDVPFTLAEAIHQAGGFLPTADDSKLVLTRGDKVWHLDFQALMAQGNLIGRICLKDGDSLQVANNLEFPVYMMGEVTRPGTLPFVHGKLSLAKALSDSGGILGTSADAHSIYVIRQGGAANAVDVYHLDARNPTAMVLADRFELNPRDLVYVDAGTLVRFSRVMGLILPTVSAITTGAAATAEVNYLRKAY